MNETTKNKLGFLIIVTSPIIIISVTLMMSLFQNIFFLGIGISLIMAWIFWGVKWAVYVEGLDGK